MAGAAGTFFGDLHHALRDHIILGICKITDPARSGKFDNFTILHLFDHYRVRDDARIWLQLQPIYARVDAFREKLLPARNKRIAHSDHGAVFDPQPLGGAPQQEWDQFWQDLDQIVSVIHEIEAGEPWHLNDVAGLSDVGGLHDALKAADCFGKLAQGDDAALTNKCADLFLSPDN